LNSVKVDPLRDRAKPWLLFAILLKNFAMFVDKGRQELRERCKLEVLSLCRLLEVKGLFGVLYRFTSVYGFYGKGLI
jgi:hypothetical protein